MSQSSRKDVGYPKSQVEVPRFIIFRACGGSGGGDCPTLLGAAEFVYPIRVPKHLVFNKSLLINNPEFLGVDIFENAGAVGLCNPAAGSRASWYLAFSDNGVLTPTEIQQKGILINAAPPFQIEVGSSKLPQPVLQGGGANPNWDNKIYVHIYWGNVNFVSFSAYLINRDERVLEIVKHNYDIKL